MNNNISSRRWVQARKIIGGQLFSAVLVNVLELRDVVDDGTLEDNLFLRNPFGRSALRVSGWVFHVILRHCVELCHRYFPPYAEGI